MSDKALMLLFFVLLFVSCKSALEQEEIVYNGPMMISSNVKTLYSENAVMKIKLEAQTQVVEQNGDVRYPDGVKITAYNKDGVIESTLKADSGKFEKALSIYTALGNVVVRNLLKDQQLETQKLFWYQNRKEVTTDMPVLITTLSEVIYGVGMTTDESFSNYRIWKMSAVFDVEAQNANRTDTLRNVSDDKNPVIGDKRRPLNRNEVKPAADAPSDDEKRKYFESFRKKTSILNGKNVNQ